MKVALVFLTVFIGGPLIFRVLTAPRPDQRQILRLAIFTAITAALGIALRLLFADQWGRAPVVTLLGVALIWLGWIGILAYGTQILRRLDPGNRMRRWTAVLGAIGTTIPWFGLASALMMAR